VITLDTVAGPETLRTFPTMWKVYVSPGVSDVTFLRINAPGYITLKVNFKKIKAKKNYSIVF